MVNVYDLQQSIKGLNDLEGAAKLEAAKNVLLAVNRAEQEIARDFSIPFHTVREVRAMIPEILATVSRLEAGARKRGAKA